MSLVIGVALLAHSLALQVDPDPSAKLPEKHETVDGFIAPPVCPPTCSVSEAIQLAAQTYGIPSSRLLCLAQRESTLRPGAINGRYAGLFQLEPGLIERTPYTGGSRLDPYTSAMATAYLISHGESSRWASTWSRC